MLQAQKFARIGNTGTTCKSKTDMVKMFAFFFASLFIPETDDKTQCTVISLNILNIIIRQTPWAATLIILFMNIKLQDKFTKVCGILKFAYL